MRVAIVHQPWNPVVPPVQMGSIAIWNHEVARRLASTHDVTAYARKYGDRPVDEYHQGVSYRRVSTFPDSNGFLMQALARTPLGRGRGLFEFGRPGYYAAFISRVAREIAQRGANVIHLHNLSHFVPILRRHNPAAKILLHMHCEWLTQLPPQVVRERIREADAVVGCSRYIAATITERFPEVSTRTGVLYNGVDASRFAPQGNVAAEATGDGRVLLYVGRISPEKGIHHLLDAFQLVLKKHPRTTLLVVGPDSVTPAHFLVSVSNDPMIRALAAFYEGSYPDQLRERTLRENGERVRFLGTVPHDRLPELFRSADVLVNPSLSESFGMSLIEANACGVSVVACDVGGMPEAIRNGETGLLVERGDVHGLAAAILRLLDDDGLRRMMGRQGAERAAAKFDWDRIAEDTLGRYRELCGGSGS